MISEAELPNYITKDIPELSPYCSGAHCQNVYSIMRVLADYSRKKFLENNHSAAKKCLSLAERIYKKGDKAIRNAFENVFVYSFTQLFPDNGRERRQFAQIAPDSLYKLYVKQMLNSHL
jgi:hypothetical protein